MELSDYALAAMVPGNDSGGLDWTKRMIEAKCLSLRSSYETCPHYHVTLKTYNIINVNRISYYFTE
jgi:hypothetical protein